MEETKKRELLLPYQDLKFFLRNVISTNNLVYVKGLQKKEWLAKLINNPIIDLEEIGCTYNIDQFILTHKNTQQHCNQHIYNNLRCAKKNVLVFKEWLNTKMV